MTFRLTALKKIQHFEKLEGKEYHVIHDDFLTYHGQYHYDLIILNPPFNEGDKHLEKALDIQKNGGNIICILNAETIDNPCTNRRKALVQKLEEYLLIKLPSFIGFTHFPMLRKAFNTFAASPFSGNHQNI